MEFTKLPTDNLYKLLALTGVLVIVLSVLMPFTFFEDAVREQIEIYGGQEVSMIELKYIDDEIQESVKKNKGMLPVEERRRLLMKLRDAKIEREKANTKLKKFGYLRKKAIEIKNYSLVTFWLGVPLAATGFLLWYFRLQRYQDVILLKQASGEDEKNSKEK